MTDNLSVTYVEIDIPLFIRDAVLLHFDLNDSPSVIVDSNTMASRTWTIVGSAHVDTTTSKFGDASLAVTNATGDCVTTPASTDFDLGSDDFTVDCWFNCTAASGLFRQIAGQVDSGGTSATESFTLERHNTDKITGKVAQGGTEFQIIGTTSFTNVTNTGWHHAAFVRTGDVLKLFIDGVQEGGDVAFTGAVNSSSNLLAVGRRGEQTGFTWGGLIDEFRLTPGSARWTANFIVPSEAEAETVTYRFAIDTDYLSNSIECIPSIKDVSFSSATISLGENLGQRASLTVTCGDHQHIFNGEEYTSGTFWGKFRARYGLKLRGRSLRLIRGIASQDLEDMETRHYVIDATDGPSSDGLYKIIAKDTLKLADNDRAQAPVISNGFLVADITNVATSATLSPAGIGDAEYPLGGYVAIGGSEIVSFSRVADVLTINRAQFNTVAVEHKAQDRVQLCLQYIGEDPATIIRNLLTTYASVNTDFINLTEWQAETAAYLGVVYTALIAEPTGVNKLCSELIEQMAGAMWWDDINEKIRLQILRSIPTTADTYDEDNFLEGSFDVAEQPDKRLSEVQVYFGKINPLVKEDQDDNYRCTDRVADDDAATDYGGSVIKKIRSRWISAGGRATADILANKQLGRYRDPPRRFNFDAMRYIDKDPSLGAGYQLGAWPLQDVDGTAVMVPIQVTRLNPKADRFEVEAEEMLWTPFGGDIDPTNRTINFDFDENNINLRTRHDELYPTPQSGDNITVRINSGVVVGSTSSSSPAIDVGSWPAGVDITVIITGRIEGHGGGGGNGSGVHNSPASVPGEAGGVALYTRQTIISMDIASGAIWGGGGGGGGGSQRGGGGGAGRTAGIGGASVTVGSGSTGTDTTGGAGASPYGGAGGAPGVAGSAGILAGAAGGAAGAAVDGISFITVTSGPGDIQGTEIN